MRAPTGREADLEPGMVFAGGPTKSAPAFSACTSCSGTRSRSCRWMSAACSTRRSSGASRCLARRYRRHEDCQRIGTGVRFVLERVRYMPKDLQSGVLYVSDEFLTAAHLCACGWGAKIRTPLGPTEWSVAEVPKDRPCGLRWETGNTVVVPTIGSTTAKSYGATHGPLRRSPPGARRKNSTGAPITMRSTAWEGLGDFGTGWAGPSSGGDSRLLNADRRLRDVLYWEVPRRRRSVAATLSKARFAIAVSDRGTLGGLRQFLTQFGFSGSATHP
jgi:hypothetical protein